jgi:hypothetical protein
VRRHRPDPRQGLFRWVWSDDGADRPDDDRDVDSEPAPPPLRARVRGRHAPRVVTLWGTPITLAKAPGRPVGRPRPTVRTIGPSEAPPSHEAGRPPAPPALTGVGHGGVSKIRAFFDRRHA